MVKETKDFSFILDAIELMQTKAKTPKWVKVVDWYLAAFILAGWATLLVFLVWVLIGTFG